MKLKKWTMEGLVEKSGFIQKKTSTICYTYRKGLQCFKELTQEILPAVKGYVKGPLKL